MTWILSVYRFYRHHVSKADTTSLAYFLILSLVPALSLLMFFSHLIHMDFKPIHDAIQLIFNESIASYVSSVLLARDISAYSLITLGICLYVCSKGIYYSSKTVNRMFGFPQEKVVYARLNSLVDTILLLLMILGFMVCVTILPIIFRYFHLDPVWRLLQYFGEFSFLFLIMVVNHRLLLRQKLKFREIYKGSLVTSVLFILIILGFSIYLRFANYTSIYGPFASLAILFLIFDFFAQAIFLGFAINALERQNYVE